MAGKKNMAKSSPELDNKIINLYHSGLKAHEVAKECNCCTSFVSKILKKNNIAIRGFKKYKYNEDFFTNIDTEEKAYVLGLFYADGNNYRSKNGYQICLKLQEQDSDIVEKVRNLIAPCHSLKFIDRLKEDHKNYIRLKFDNKIISDQLIKLGCIPNKSMVLEYPEWLIDPELQRHFIRGYFDGDGSIFYENKELRSGRLDWSWSITCTNKFGIKVKEFIENQLYIHCSLSIQDSKQSNITSTLSVAGSIQLQKIYKWMYKDATIYMNRKYNKYLEFLDYCNWYYGQEQLNNKKHKYIKALSDGEI